MRLHGFRPRCRIPTIYGRALSSQPQILKPYYVTTPIYYVNAVPHVGHLYSSVLADVLARWSRLRHPGRPVLLTTGTDEYGLKIERAAAANGVDPSEFCDTVSQSFRELASAANISYTRFIRTTEDVHRTAVQHVWTKMQDRGHIYKGKHSGWYCVADECFYGEAQVEKVGDIMVSKESGRPVEWAEEDNYMFRLSAFQQPLADWMQANRTIIPNSRYGEVIEYVKDPSNLKDLSISRPRSRLKWGITVPGDPDHTIYVWLDALVNYLTAVGYPWDGGKWDLESNGWPADVQVVGKDIVKFHAVYWPAFLMAIGLSPPKQILAHAHWTMERKKMSKSTGNVADPFQAIDKYGADAVRMYLCAAGGNLVDDADWSDERLDNFYDGILRSNLGNLQSRILGKAIVDRAASEPFKYLGDDCVLPEDLDIHTSLQGKAEAVDRQMGKMEFSQASTTILDGIAQANAYFTALRPWDARQPVAVAARARFYASEALRISAILLQPFMPSKASAILDSLQVTRRDFEASTIGAEPQAGQLKPKPAEHLFPSLKHQGKIFTSARLEHKGESTKLT